MIRDIVEINFPEYATLSTATASLVDMGDKTITAQVKIDGAITPDFSYDWEIEFQGERYIQPLREPQASKGNESMSSTIDLTFYHKGIYDLKRYFFVSVPNVDSGVVMADDYIVPLQLNLKEFVVYLNKVFEVYGQQYRGVYKAFLNPDIEIEDTDKKSIDINYTKIWDVITSIYERFGVRWHIEESDQGNNLRTYDIRIGYPANEVTHTFEYGFEGGLLKFERQVQSPEIANMVFGRGSSENIPYRYFKNKSEDNPTFPADPDWIPELENVYFANLRGKTFRDYVKGWKAKHYGGETMDAPTKEYTRGYTDEKFNPIEYVSDEESIVKYGEIQKGLEYNEEIKPTIQGVSIDGVGRVDQVVDVEEILVDESIENTEWESKVIDITHSDIVANVDINTSTYNIRTTSEVVEVPRGYTGRFIKDVVITAIEEVKCKDKYSNSSPQGDTFYPIVSHPLTVTLGSIRLIDEDTKEEITNIISIAGGTRFRIEYSIKVSNFLKDSTYTKENYPYYGVTTTVWRTVLNPCKIISSLSWQLDYTPVHGQVLGNYASGTTRKSKSISIPANGSSQVVFTTEQFTISDKDAPATNVDMPFRVIASHDGAQYDAQPNVVAINADTKEQITAINLPAGTYYLQNSIQITNLASKSQTFKVELLPTYIYYSYESTSWKPTFDIWVKNIWQTTRQWTDPVDGVANPETDEQYATRVWDAILGNHLGNEAKVVFSSGWLSGHSDWEFTIARRPVYDKSKIIDGVPSEWRITLYKSDAEMEATDKWLPSIATHANAGDYFYFVGIEMPHQYVLWAEDKLDKYKHDELDKVSNVKSTIVVQLDKIRANQLQSNETRPLLDSLRIGNNIKVADSRFIQSSHETLHLQSITYTWDTSTIMLPNIDVVLSDDVVTSTNLIKNIQHRVDDTIRSVNTLRTNSLVQINKAKKSIRDTNTSIKALSSGSIDMTNQVKALIGDDMWMSSREIAEDAIAEEAERIDATYAKLSDIASLEDYVDDEIDKKVGKTDTINANMISELASGAKGIAATAPIVANRIPQLRADAFAFLQPEDFTVEVAYDGRTWETLDNNNADMRGMFAQLNYGTGFSIDGSNTNWQVGSKIRITLSPKVARNAKVDFVALNVFANGRTFNILTEYYNSSSGKEGWYSVGDQLNIISNGIAFVKYNQYFSFAGYARGGARFTFTITKNTQYGSKIVGLSGYGNLSTEITPTSSNAPYTLGTLWYWDYLKNITFPNGITANSLKISSGTTSTLLQGDGTPVSKTSIDFDVTQPSYIGPNYAWKSNGVWPILASQIDVYRANRLAFLQDDEYEVEKSADGGATWTTTAKDDAMRRVFIGLNNGNISIPSSTTDMMRITIKPKSARYSRIDFFYMWVSCPSEGNTFAKIEFSTATAPDTWDLHSSATISGLSGPNMMKYQRLFGSGSGVANVRFTIYNTVDHTIGTSVYGIQGHGSNAWGDINNMYKSGHLYSWDVAQNAKFPAKIVASSFEDRDGNAVMLTKDIPTEVATATQRRLVTSQTPIIGIVPNIMYDWGSTSWLTSLSIPSLIDGDGNYDNKWMLRFTLWSSDNLSIGFDVFWKDGIAPTWSGWAICEITFYRDVDNTTTIGEWKIFR